MALTWSQGTLNIATTVRLWRQCIWAPELGKFIAIAETAGAGSLRAATSPDGVTWTSATMTANSWEGVAWNGSIAVAVSLDAASRVRTSPDGINWTNRTASAANQWASVVWASGQNQFVAVAASGAQRVMTSADGITWAGQTASSAQIWQALSYSPSLNLLVAGAASGSTNCFMTSPDGVTWTDRSVAVPSSIQANCITWSPALGMFVAGSTGPKVYTSTNGTSWTDQGDILGGTVASGIAWSPELGLFLAVANGTTYATSPNGSTWTLGTMSDGVHNFNHTWNTVGYSPTLRRFAVLLGADAAGVTALADGVVDGITPTAGPGNGTTALTITSAAGAGGGFNAATYPNGFRVFIDYRLETVAALAGVADGTVLPLGFPATGLLEATNVVVGSVNSLTCTAPVGLGVSDVLVVGYNAFNIPTALVWLPNAYTYRNPTLTGISPSSGPGPGGTIVTLTGTDLFSYGTTASGGTSSQVVAFGGNYATDVVVVNATTITCVAPFHFTTDPSTVDVRLESKVAINPAIGVGGTGGFELHYPNSTLLAAYTYTPVWWTFDIPPLDDVDLDLPPFRFYTYGVDPPGDDNPDYPCPLLFLLQIGGIDQETYDKYVDPNDPCELLFPDPDPDPAPDPDPDTGIVPTIPFPHLSHFSWPNTSWHVTAAPPDRGWWASINDRFAGASYLVDAASIPVQPRSYREIAGFAAGTAFGGFPGVMAVHQNRLIYAKGGYAVGTAFPTLHSFDGSFNREVASLPATSNNGKPFAVLTTLAAGGQVYVATYDSGSTSTTFAGRVFSFDLETSLFTQLGGAFPAGHLPYALAWHMGRLWVGTNCSDPLVPGKVYFLRDTDTTWTLDTTLASGGVTSLLSFQGLLYVGTSAPAGTFAALRVRDGAGIYTSSTTGSGGVARTNNAWLALAEFSAKLYASYWNPDTPAVSKIAQFDGTSWTTVYTGSGSTLVPYIGFPVDQDTLLAAGGGVGYNAALVGTTTGTTWTDRTAFLPQTTPASTLVPAFGVVKR